MVDTALVVSTIVTYVWRSTPSSVLPPPGVGAYVEFLASDNVTCSQVWNGTPPLVSPTPPPQPPPGPKMGIIFAITAADFNATASQPLIAQQAFDNFSVSRVFVSNATTSLTNAVGGIYTAPNKGGVAIVPASQSYAGLKTSTQVFNPSLTPAAANLLTVDGLHFAPTIAQGAPATGDIYVEGLYW